MEKIITLPETPYENIVYSIWKRILGHNEFGIDDDFFEAGGNSMKALEVISELNEKFEFDINDFFGTPNIRSIAKGLHENPEAMKARLKDVLEFRESKVKDINEWQKYEASYQAIVDIKKEIDAYQHILVLGATGFLGVYLLREILIQSKAKVTVLIRGKGIERLQHQYNNFFGEGAFEKEINRIQVVNGDLTKNYMGLSEEDFKKLSENIDAIVNSAALVKHMGKNAEFETVNINIVKNIIELAAIGRKKVIHHMSTLGITYGEQGESKKSLFTEYDETVHHELTNQYLHSKYEAEQILFKARNQGIESTIYRMNGILFDSMTGKYQENMAQSTNYVFYRNLYKLGIIPEGMRRPMDISNVDMISKAIVTIMFSNRSKGEIYHIVSPYTLPIGEILQMMAASQTNKKFEVMNIEEIYDYYTKSTDKECFSEIAFECEIISYIAKNQLNICMEKTVHILRALEFEWNIPDQEAIRRACIEAQRVGFA